MPPVQIFTDSGVEDDARHAGLRRGDSREKAKLFPVDEPLSLDRD